MIVTDYLDMVIGSGFVMVGGHLASSSQRKSSYLPTVTQVNGSQKSN